MLSDVAGVKEVVDRLTDQLASLQLDPALDAATRDQIAAFVREQDDMSKAIRWISADLQIERWNAADMKGVLFVLNQYGVLSARLEATSVVLRAIADLTNPGRDM